MTDDSAGHDGTPARPENEFLAREILEAMPLPLVVVDAAGLVLDMSPLAERFFGISRAVCLQRDWRHFPGLEIPNGGGSPAFDDHDHDHELDAADASGTMGIAKLTRGYAEFAVEIRVAPMLSASSSGSQLLVFRDATAERNAISRLAHQARHDALTHLCNRREFERRLQAVVSGLNGSASHALFFIDLDGFKSVNDTAGHAAGDEILRQVAKLFGSVVRERDTLARLGGDEFALLLEHCPMDEALQTARLLRTLLRNTHFEWEELSFDLGVSIGIVCVRAPGTDAESLISMADEACYRAKRKGFSAIEVRSPYGAQHPSLAWS